MNEILPPMDTKAFAHILQQLEDGQLHHDLTEAIPELIAALHEAAIENGGTAKGALTLKLAFKLEGGVLQIDSGYALKLPEHKRLRTITWVTEANGISFSNPRQLGLPGVRDVSSRRKIVTV